MMLAFFWKAAVFAHWGTALLVVAAAVVAMHLLLPLRRLSWRLIAHPGSLDSWRGICSKSPEHDADHGEADECSNGRLRSVRSREPGDGYD